MLSTDEKLILALGSAAASVSTMVAADAEANLNRLIEEYGEPTLEEQLDILGVMKSDVDKHCPLKLRYVYLKTIDLRMRDIKHQIKNS